MTRYKIYDIITFRLKERMVFLVDMRGYVPKIHIEPVGFNILFASDSHKSEKLK